MQHRSEFRWQMFPQQTLGVAPRRGHIMQLCALPLNRALRFRQVFCVTQGSLGAGYDGKYTLEFWSGVLLNWNTSSIPVFSPLGQLVLEIPVWIGRPANGSDTEFHTGQTTSGTVQLPSGPWVSYGSNASGIRSATKNFDLDIEADFCVLNMQVDNHGAAWVAVAWLGIISSDFPALPYHEQNFQPIFT